MKTLITMLLVSSIAAAQPECDVKGGRINCDAKTLGLEIPREEIPGSGGDAPVLDTESPTMAPDVPEISVRLRPGEAAPFDGRLISLHENVRRGKAKADCDAELADAQTNEWMPKPVLITLIVVPPILAAAAAALITGLALKQP